MRQIAKKHAPRKIQHPIVILTISLLDWVLLQFENAKMALYTSIGSPVSKPEWMCDQPGKCDREAGRKALRRYFINPDRIVEYSVLPD
jgi:hypothetical protein